MRIFTAKRDPIIIKNKVQEYCTSKGIDERQYMSLCLGSTASVEGRVLGEGPARRAWNGDTGISFGTVALLIKALDAKQDDLFEIK